MVAISLTADGRRGTIEFFDIRSAAFVRQIETDGQVTTAMFSLDGEWLAISYDVQGQQNRFSDRRSVTAVHGVPSGKAVLRTPPD